jgi:hypothetical protein
VAILFCPSHGRSKKLAGCASCGWLCKNGGAQSASTRSSIIFNTSALVNLGLEVANQPNIPKDLQKITAMHSQPQYSIKCVKNKRRKMKKKGTVSGIFLSFFSWCTASQPAVDQPAFRHSVCRSE